VTRAGFLRYQRYLVFRPVCEDHPGLPQLRGLQAPDGHLGQDPFRTRWQAFCEIRWQLPVKCRRIILRRPAVRRRWRDSTYTVIQEW